MQVFIIGVGGTGGNLAPMIARFMPNHWKMTLIDGDKVEYSNLSRQPFQEFNVGEFKAEALARKIATATAKDIRFKNLYLTKDKQLWKLIDKNDMDVMIISCVDNHPARMVIENEVKRIHQANMFYIDSANEHLDGEIITYTSSYRQQKGKFRSQLFPEIKDIKDGDVTQKSCSTEIDEGNTQQYSTNYFAASIIFNQVFNYTNEIPIKTFIKFDNKLMKMAGRNV